MSLANAFKSLTDMFAGKKSGGGGAAVAAAGMEGVAESADNAGTAMGGAGSAAKRPRRILKVLRVVLTNSMSFRHQTAVDPVVERAADMRPTSSTWEKLILQPLMRWIVSNQGLIG